MISKDTGPFWVRTADVLKENRGALALFIPESIHDPVQSTGLDRTSQIVRVHLKGGHSCSPGPREALGLLLRVAPFFLAFLFVFFCIRLFTGNIFPLDSFRDKSEASFCVVLLERF